MLCDIIPNPAEIVSPKVWEQWPMAAALLVAIALFLGFLLLIMRSNIKANEAQQQRHEAALASAQEQFTETLNSQEKGCVEQTKHICERFDQTTKQMFELLRGKIVGNGS